MRLSSTTPVAVALGLAVSCGLGTTAATAATASHHIRNGQIATDYGAEAIYLQTTDPVIGATSDIGAPNRIRGCNLAASEDAKTLAYSTVCGYFAGRGHDTVSVMNRDGTGQRVVWQMPSDFGLRQSVVGNPAISPDGKRIVFGTALTIASPQTRYWTINTDGTGLAPLDLGVSTAPDRVPRFSPDGRTLAFTVGGVIWLKKGDKPAAPLTVRKPGLPNDPHGWLRAGSAGPRTAGTWSSPTARACTRWPLAARPGAPWSPAPTAPRSTPNPLTPRTGHR